MTSPQNRTQVPAPRPRRTDPARLTAELSVPGIGPALNSDQVAKALRITRDSLHSAVSSGRFPKWEAKVGGHVYWSEELLDRYLDQQSQRVEDVGLDAESLGHRAAIADEAVHQADTEQPS
ncbi:helix-turn-helix domain-containing protein [Streptomyces rimosus]|uniref:helix-turn-helix domain-containing protein n=1 Tax=Streptomyces rimosus TaxID=1927 RepID=UPI000A57B8CD|nr:helix-turn-helix domain-containing protein [Streptomyces rimosus]